MLVVVTGPVGKLFVNLESYLVHIQIHGLVPIKLYALVFVILVLIYVIPSLHRSSQEGTSYLQAPG